MGKAREDSLKFSEPASLSAGSILEGIGGGNNGMRLVLKSTLAVPCSGRIGCDFQIVSFGDAGGGSHAAALRRAAKELSGTIFKGGNDFIATLLRLGITAPTGRGKKLVPPTHVVNGNQFRLIDTAYDLSPVHDDAGATKTKKVRIRRKVTETE